MTAQAGFVHRHVNTPECSKIWPIDFEEPKILQRLSWSKFGEEIISLHKSARACRCTLQTSHPHPSNPEPLHLPVLVLDDPSMSSTSASFLRPFRTRYSSVLLSLLSQVISTPRAPKIRRQKSRKSKSEISVLSRNRRTSNKISLKTNITTGPTLVSNICWRCYLQCRWKQDLVVVKDTNLLLQPCILRAHHSLLFSICSILTAVLQFSATMILLRIKYQIIQRWFYLMCHQIQYFSDYKT